MKRNKSLTYAVALSMMFFFGIGVFMESGAWARAGGGGSQGSRSSRSFSAPNRPSPVSPGPGGQGGPNVSASPPSRSPGLFGGSPLVQGIAGGVAGGLLGSMLFGGSSHAASRGGMGGGGIGLFDIFMLSLLAYIGYRFYRSRRARAVASGLFASATNLDGIRRGWPEVSGAGLQKGHRGDATDGEVERGFQQVGSNDPDFDEERLKEELQDLFFQTQAAWTNRSLEGVDDKITNEMREYFANEFDSMKERGVINRLENIAVRKVEPAEAWQETDKDYVTVLFTANLLDYTVDDKTGAIVSGDKTSPVNFMEFWTFCRMIGARQWKLSAISQVEEPGARGI